MYLLNQRDKSINSYCSFAIPVLRYHIGSSTMSIIRVTCSFYSFPNLIVLMTMTVDTTRWARSVTRRPCISPTRLEFEMTNASYK
jgi:hypothetical protein